MAEKGKETREVAPWRPFTDLAHWERDMERMMDGFFDRRVRSWWPERYLGTEGFLTGTPSLDVYEEKDDIVVKAELPGLEKDDVEVNLSGHKLTIKGEKKKKEEVKKEDYYRSECSYGSFVRSVELPAAVQADRIKASFKNGVLEVRLPKTEEAKAREIKIKVN